MLAESPKSVRTYNAYNAAKKLVKETENFPVPLHIRNAPTGLMKTLGYGRDYRFVDSFFLSSSPPVITILLLFHLPTAADLLTLSYNPSYAHPVYQPFLPPELAGKASFLQDDSSLDGKKVDEAALREWEWKTLGGMKWEGREEMARRLKELEESAGVGKEA